jgi:ferredoxin
MALAKSLGGVISGEHGIGITKLEFLSDAEIRPFRDYKQRIDPEGRFNRGKLMPGGRTWPTPTPSFALLGVESLIMEQSDIGKISDSIKNCLRCGKCKPVCSTHVPRANLLYSPRNKILGTSLLIEAFLYEEQTRRGISCSISTSFPTSPTTARSATSASRPARWTSISATSRWRCATSCAARARRSSTPARRRRWPSSPPPTRPPSSWCAPA